MSLEDFKKNQLYKEDPELEMRTWEVTVSAHIEDTKQKTATIKAMTKEQARTEAYDIQKKFVQELDNKLDQHVYPPEHIYAVTEVKE